MSQHHVLRASPETCHWGFFDAALKPVLTVASGDTVTVDSVSGGPDVLPPEALQSVGQSGGRFEILPDHLAIHQGLEPKLGAHILTGPIAVEGAEPGDVLAIEILAIDPRQNWGYTRIRPLSGTLPEDFPVRRIWHTAIDRQRGVATVPWGAEIDLAPFFGVMGVAPPANYGAVTSIVPREFGGNMDLKELTAGATSVSAGVDAGRLVFGRRRAWRAGRRRGLRDGTRNRVDRHLSPDPAQGHEDRPAARRDADASDHHGV